MLVLVSHNSCGAQVGEGGSEARGKIPASFLGPAGKCQRVVDCRHACILLLKCISNLSLVVDYSGPLSQPINPPPNPSVWCSNFVLDVQTLYTILM